MPPRSNLDQVGTGRATLSGFSAVLMWSLLAALTVATGQVPPFQLAALCFAIGGGLGLVWRLVRGEAGLFARQPAKVWLHGIGGIFGYHFLYFTALRHGSPAEVSLIAYLWPLLIVLLSVLLPGH
ncbi:MAG: EamA family transporter, partial [Arenicellales bacterium]|nr:EamA family transporter [Arenicellales bacterium]